MRRWAAVATAGLALTLGACGGDEPPEPATRSAAPSATRNATPAAPPARRVRFRASDGKAVKGAYHPRNVLFVSDHREQSSVASLSRGAIGSRRAVSEVTGHGVALLENETNRRVVLDWLERHVK